MKISIITASYNSSATIRDAAESVLNQKNIDLEYIFVDGASKDGTTTIIEEYAQKYPQIVKYISEKDNGIYDAMNKGIALCTGDIIGILNSDDLYANDTVLEKVVKTIDNDNVDSCYGNLLYTKAKKPYRFWKSGKSRTFKYGWMPPHPAFFVKRELYEKYGSFRLDCGTAADYELMLRFFHVHGISSQWIDSLFIYMRVGGASNENSTARKEAYKADVKAWKINSGKNKYIIPLLKRVRKINQFFIRKGFDNGK